jgi:hypothetical protein
MPKNPEETGWLARRRARIRAPASFSAPASCHSCCSSYRRCGGACSRPSATTSSHWPGSKTWPSSAISLTGARVNGGEPIRLPQLRSAHRGHRASGRSGLGKTTFLREIAAKATRPVAFLHARGQSLMRSSLDVTSKARDAEL